MIIIEEDETDKEYRSKGKTEYVEEETLSDEEQQYRNAAALVESVDCVVRYERAVSSLQHGAALFEALGDYRDSRQRAAECIRQAQELEETGREKAYQEAVQLCDTAVTPMDYRTAISELERFSDYKDCKERIASCRQTLTRMASRRMWHNRSIAAVILAVLLLAAWISPLKPYAKGILHMRQGHYRMAVANFREAGDFLNSTSQKKKCRYYQAQKAYDAGNVDRAAALCRLAWGRSEADKLLAQIEVEQLGSTKSGEVVQFGKRNWIVLSAQGSQRILLYHDTPRHKAYAKHKDNPQLAWSDSYIRKWCNSEYKTLLFNQSERKLLAQVQNDPSGEKTDKLYFLSVQEYRQYGAEIQKADVGEDTWKTERWWLRDLDQTVSTTTVSGKAQELVWKACTVDGQGETAAAEVDEKYALRPVIQVTLDAALLES
jgi:hypothetical protein